MSVAVVNSSWCSCVDETNFNVYYHIFITYLLPTGSEEREVLEVGSIPVAILLSCQYMKNIAG